MSTVRDNTPAGASNIPPSTTDTDPTDTSNATNGAPIHGPTEAAINNRHERAEEDLQARQQAFQSDFAKKIADPPGFGSNEDDQSKELKKGFAASNLPVPTRQQVQLTQANVGQTKEFKAAVDGVKGIMANNGEPQAGVNMGHLLTQALNSSTVLSKANVASSKALVGASSSGAPGASPGVEPTSDAEVSPITTSDALPTTETDPTTTSMASSGSGLPVTTNTSALVFLVILQAQQENTKEKSDILKKIKMFNSGLDAVNTYVNTKLIPAQRQLEQLTNDGKGKKDFNAANVQVEVDGAMGTIDTDNFMQNADTGQTVLIGQVVPRQLVSSTGLGTLIQQADNARQSIQNNQTRESNRFQSKDSQMASAWNILNAVLKNTHDGVSSTVRNI